MAKVNGKKLGLCIVGGVSFLLILGVLAGTVTMAMSGEGGNSSAPAATTIEGSAGTGTAVGAAIPADDNKTPAECSFNDWVGKAAAEAEAAARETGRPFRMLPPGSVKTMDYRHDRINIELDGKGIVTKVNCG